MERNGKIVKTQDLQDSKQKGTAPIGQVSPGPLMTNARQHYYYERWKQSRLERKYARDKIERLLKNYDDFLNKPLLIEDPKFKAKVGKKKELIQEMARGTRYELEFLKTFFDETEIQKLKKVKFIKI